MTMNVIRKIVCALALMVSSAVSVAHAGLAIVAHPNNPLAGITAEQAAMIYLGKTRSFPDGKRAVAVDQSSNSPMRKKFSESVLKKNDRELKTYWSKLLFTGKARPPEELGGDEEVKAWIAKNRDGIGYVDSKSLDRSIKVLLILP